MFEDNIINESKRSDILNQQFYEQPGKKYLGVVVNNEDPKFEGRCKIKVFGIWDELKEEELPWCYPYYSTIFAGGEKGGFGSISYPKKNHLVTVIFDEDDYYHPFYTNVVMINPKLKDEIKVSYENCQVLVYDEDEDLKILYTKEKGVMIWSKESYINIDKNQHIKLFHKGGPSYINLIEGDITEFTNSSHYIDSPAVKVGTEASYDDTRCPPLMDLLENLCTIIDSKMPASGPLATNLFKAYKMQICSDVVTIA